jgi:phosphoglycolate phosphatase-like HAD superfamily hydrolase
MATPETITYCLAVDSDGCVFDSMNTKQESCFIPRLVAVWNLEEYRPQVTERALDLNLRSHRGENRFRNLLALFDELRADPDLRDSPVSRIDLGPLRDWVTSGAPLSTESLEAARAQTASHLLGQALEWTLAVNRAVAALPAARPFAQAAATLCRAPADLELQVVSSANHEALQREWQAAGLLPLVHLLHGQEKGSKEKVLRGATRRFSPSRILMVGDAPADHEAAMAAGVLFFPIRAGRENSDWQFLGQHILPRFTGGEETASLLTPAIAAWKAGLREKSNLFPRVQPN